MRWDGIESIYILVTQQVFNEIFLLPLQIFEMIFDMRISSNYRVGFPRIHHSSREGGSDEIDYLLSPYSPFLKLAHTDNVKLLESDKQLYRRETLLFGHSPTSKSCLTTSAQQKKFCF